MSKVMKFSDAQRSEYVNAARGIKYFADGAMPTDEEMEAAGMVPEMEIAPPAIEEVPVKSEVESILEKIKAVIADEAIDKDVKKQAEELLPRLEEAKKALEDGNKMVESIAPKAPEVTEPAAVV